MAPINTIYLLGRSVEANHYASVNNIYSPGRANAEPSAFQNLLRWIVLVHPQGFSHFSVCVIDCCPPRTEVFEKNVFHRLEHQVLVMDGVVRIQAVVGSIWKRRTNWVHIKYLKTSLTHGPGRVSVVQLYPLEGVNLNRKI